LSWSPSPPRHLISPPCLPLVSLPLPLVVLSPLALLCHFVPPFVIVSPSSFHPLFLPPPPCAPPHCCSCPPPCHSLFPPCEQLLMAVVHGAAVVVVMGVVSQHNPPSSSSSSPHCVPSWLSSVVIVPLPLVVIPPISVPLIPPPLVSLPHCRSTHQPPHKQLLMRLRVGSVSSVGGVVISTHHPPHKQVLMRLEGHPVPIIIIPILSDVVGIQQRGCAYLVGILLHGPPGASLFLLAICSLSLHHPPCKQRLTVVG